MASSQTCPICLEDIQGNKNCTTTECGHTFHSSCIFSNLCHRIECPCCRSELVPPSEDEEEEDEYEESIDEEGSDTSFDEVDQDNSEPKMKIEHIVKRLVTMGYTMEDLVLAHLGGSFCRGIKGRDHQTPDFFAKYEETLDDIILGNIAPEYRDTRTFAQVVAGVPSPAPSPALAEAAQQPII